MTGTTYIAVSITLINLGIVCYELVKRRNKRKAESSEIPHVHKPIPIAAQELELNSESIHSAISHHTAVLFTCECKIHWVSTFAGKWSIEHFLRKESELIELERLMR